MYPFIDTNTASEGGALPSEALKLNGEYIENQIHGYRTLHVSGREALSPEIDSFTVGIRDGSSLKNKRYPERTIVVTYQLRTDSPESFREAYNKLAGILDVEDAELIFNDEPDKFFTGTPSAIREVEPGRNAVVGEIEILCVDPFKYSVAEYEVLPSANELSVLIDYKGTYKAFPTFEAKFYNETEISGNTVTALTGRGDCGYVAFFDESQNIIQIGDPDEVDNDNSGSPSQTLIHQEFLSSDAWGSAAQGLWTKNSGSVFPDNTVQLGTVGMGAASYNSNGSANAYYLTATNYGAKPSMWHGPSITRSIPADSTGSIGARNFLVSYKHKMCIGSAINCVNQYGDFQIQLSNMNGKVIAGARICKWQSGKSGSLMLYVNGKWVKSFENIDLSHWNALTGRDESTIPTSWIRKTESEVVFNMIGIRYVFNDEAIRDSIVTKMTIMFGSYSDKPAMSYNGLFWVKFVKDNCNTYRDVPNKFSANDRVIADCRNAEIYLNGSSMPSLGALGNDWEHFYLTPGLNHIGFSYSEWVPSAYAPKFSIKYREVFL